MGKSMGLNRKSVSRFLEISEMKIIFLPLPVERQRMTRASDFFRNKLF